MGEQQPQDSQSPTKAADGSSGRHPKPARENLRKYLRFRIDEASAELHIQGFLTSFGLGKVHKARAAINLSEGGVLLLAREILPVGTKVKVRIEMEKYADLIESEGVVKWCQQSARSDQDYYAGIEFCGLGPADLKKIGQMREWFTSPEYRSRSATRRRTRPPTIET